MGETTSRAKVSVALVGVGSTWERHYSDAAQRLSSKICVRAICDGVFSRAHAIAEEMQARAIPCPWTLTQRTDLHAWLILDPGWFGTYPAALAVRQGRSALFANPFCSSIASLKPIFQESREQGELLMPEFPERFMPSTTRLRELMATKLGQVRQIELSVPREEFRTAADWLQSNQATAIGLIDWCAWLVGAAIHKVRFTNRPDQPKLQFEFPPRLSAPSQPEVTLLLVGDQTSTRRVVCDRGWAQIDSPVGIAWGAGDTESRETLTHERSPYEIILDQFCRRALGGLLPVPTANHALQAIVAFEQALDAANSVGKAS